MTKKNDSIRGVPAPDETSDMTIEEFCRKVRCSRSKAHRLINDGKIDAYKSGGSTIVTRASYEKMREVNRVQPKGAMA